MRERIEPTAEKLNADAVVGTRGRRFGQLAI
jgi:uncharacterized protein YbjQ (UPF0145 family)